MELSTFDNDLPEGRQLNSDLKVLALDLDLARSLARSMARSSSPLYCSSLALALSLLNSDLQALEVHLLSPKP